MTVAQLIKRLSSYDPAMPVMVSENLDEVRHVRKAYLSVHKRELTKAQRPFAKADKEGDYLTVTVVEISGEW